MFVFRPGGIRSELPIFLCPNIENITSERLDVPFSNLPITSEAMNFKGLGCRGGGGAVH